MAAKPLTEETMREAQRAYARTGSDRAAALLRKIPAATQRSQRERGDDELGPLPAFACPNAPIRKKRLLITCAQNATPVHKPFLAALERYCKHHGAQLVVIPLRYKNPTSSFSKRLQDLDWWDPAIVPYLYDKRTKLGKHLVLLADIKTQPTADRPLVGFETITGAASGILGHPKLALESIATPHHRLPKIITTTGAVTRKNYTETKAGKKGDFHHCMGAAIVELDGDSFHLRQCNAARDGSFIDLAHAYSASKVTKASRAAAVVLGDEHEQMMDPEVREATYGHGGILDTLRPEVVVHHDALDFYSRNHHHAGRPFINLAKHKARLTSVEAEVDSLVRFYSEHAPRGALHLFPFSNHPDALARWMESADWKSDPENAEFYLETALHMARSAKMLPNRSTVLDPFAYWVDRKLGRHLRLKFLGKDESYQAAGIEVGMHGHLGPNGARGSVAALSKIGVKTITGHTHNPAIRDGAYQVGTSSYLRLEYNAGPSSWLHTHAVVYANGKRSLINIIDGRWHA